MARLFFPRYLTILARGYSPIELARRPRCPTPEAYHQPYTVCLEIGIPVPRPGLKPSGFWHTRQSGSYHKRRQRETSGVI